VRALVHVLTSTLLAKISVHDYQQKIDAARAKLASDAKSNAPR
jgi:hypothetical protein